ncbi:zinc finger X-chromosomal protein-like [Nasonia vitripennis]|uniref:C2H2-type domain-containing protein n=1 Tax=Nasonia vitripennis TaxID=7425 RepID=A0A7M7IRP2_NASVI|nr:zinc finger X-chromosomal protein-like [Nasonia vitripennis]
MTFCFDIIGFPDSMAQNHEQVIAFCQSEESISNPQQPLNRHYTIVNVCFQCGKSYAHATTLKRHLTYECNKPPRFCCSYCPQRCKHKNDIKGHILRCHKGQNISFYEL